MRDVLGYAAALTVLASFLMHSMVPLRLLAIVSNVLFLSYGFLADIHPVFALHAALLPINVVRLVTYRGGGALFRACRYRRFAAATGRVRHVLLFVSGFAAGSLGIRTVIHVVLAFCLQCRRNFV